MKANQVFLPMLENASKANKLRTTLGVFERSKFFFNLPGFIIESVEAVRPLLLLTLVIRAEATTQGRYDVAIRDYKRGKVLMETRPGQLLPFNNGKDGQVSVSADQQQKRVLEKVWGSVEKAMGEMKNALLSQLQDPSRTLEEHEKTME